LETLTQTWNLEIVAGNSLGNVLSFAAALFTTMVVARLVHTLIHSRLRTWAARTSNDLDDALIEALERPINLLILGFGSRAAVACLVLPDGLEQIVEHVLTVVVTVFIAWGVTRIVDALRTVFIDPRVAASESKLDDQVVPIADKTIKVVIWSMAVLISFSNLGYDIVSLLTGLGIGGLAIAMAAQATLSNLLGSFTIFADQPFQVDDWITVDGHSGVVTEVGLRAVRLLTFEGRIVTLPNNSVVSTAVINPSVDRRWRQDGVLTLTYDSSHDDVKRALAILGEIFDAHPDLGSDHSARFRAFGDSALEISFAYWLQAGRPRRWLDIRSEINLEIKRRFDEAGLSFAFPTMSLHVVSLPKNPAA